MGLKVQELRALSDEQLVDNLREAVKELFQVRFRAAAEKNNAPSSLRELRRRIARIKTLQRERGLALENASETGK
ncbi:50S ribosomal protein L29 [bacterium]|jgi:large subunit ribosomal protein L29|nr:50S ribosomal protein L29 [bacterium]